SNDKRWRAARPIIEPETVWRLELAVRAAGAAPGADPFGVLVVLMDVIGTIAVADIETAIRGEGDGGWPILLDARVNASLNGVTQFPDLLALEVGLENLAIVNIAQVKKLFAALLANVDAVAAGIVTLAEGTHVLALGIEDDDSIHRRSAMSLMLDINEPGIINGHAVRRLPAQFLRQLSPLVNTLVAIVALADDGVLRTPLVACEKDCGSRTCHHGRRARGGRLFEKITPFHGRFSSR